MHQKLHLKGRLCVAFPATQFLFYAQSRNEIYFRSSAQSYIFPVTQPLDNCVPCSTLNHLAPLKPANSLLLHPLISSFLAITAILTQRSSPVATQRASKATSTLPSSPLKHSDQSLLSILQ